MFDFMSSKKLLLLMDSEYVVRTPSFVGQSVSPFVRPFVQRSACPSFIPSVKVNLSVHPSRLKLCCDLHVCLAVYCKFSIFYVVTEKLIRNTDRSSMYSEHVFG